MKKTILLVALSLVMGFSAKAQLGIKAGVNFSKMSNVNSSDEKFLYNLQAGVFMDKDIIPLVDLRFGLNFSPKGSRVEVDADNYVRSTISYLEIPVLAKVKLGPVYALGGFYGAYALNGNTELMLVGIETNTEIDFDNAELSKLDFGMTFGLGVQFGIGPLHIFAQTEYSLGMKNLNTVVGDEVKNSVIGVSIGVLLGR